ncbi:MAG: putative selenate reductase subunit YgfK [Deltaproteobacteria bacterium]|nr:putative selenate reductase subunit YgfK [Deltaproteobacteria bacterium]
MSDRFFPLGISKLFKQIINEYESRREIFGITESLFFNPTENKKLETVRFGKVLETPLGVAAGPHTQLAQNIIAAWLCGARYIELKTVQTLDEIEVAKPCIDIEDEGYNCEWSQELKLRQSHSEYLKAWIIIHALKNYFKWNRDDSQAGFIFNMSVGYSLEGIMNENVQEFLDLMENSGDILSDYLTEISHIYPEIRNISIPARMSDNLTLSTMHGCPPDEIEKIGMYLITQRKYHTVIKLNPTLLGATDLRKILNSTCGYETVVPDIAFEHDLKYGAALSLLDNLENAASGVGVQFGIKLTNTLESVNTRHVLPADQEMNYMSGRALYPIVINLASRLQKQLGGKLDISLSGGADAFNISDIIKCNIRPVTVCSDILRPGGYGRLAQYVENLNSACDGKEKLLDIIEDNGGAGMGFLHELAGKVLKDHRYYKDANPWPSIKTSRPLGWFDCIHAPCEDTCPTHQNIPTYMYHVSRNEPQKALEVIRDSNPFPYTTGLACDHKCEDKCTRSNYDRPLLIRDIKRYAAYNGETGEEVKPADAVGKKAAIIGGGPGGLSCAWYLANAGFEVTVYESSSKPGGMLSSALPDFRMLPDGLENDLDRIRKSGVKIKTGVTVDKEKFNELRSTNDYIYLGVGAPKGKELELSGDRKDGVIDFLDFLNGVKDGTITSVPENTVIIGGGNSAIDAARTAWRLSPKIGNVWIIYRRTVKEMPADREEIKALFEEGIKVRELLNPVHTVHKMNQLTGVACNAMKLGEPDASGRRRPEAIEGKVHLIPAQLCIVAIGQDTRLDFVNETGIELTRYGTILVDENTHETTLPGVYAGGDVVHGPSSIIQAIADGKEAAYSIMKKSGISVDKLKTADKELEYELKVKKARRVYSVEVDEKPVSERRNFDMVVHTLNAEQAAKEASRCLYCDELCNVCVTVCPNRANVSYVTMPASFRNSEVTFTSASFTTKLLGSISVAQAPQVLNITDFCNECGNCTTFCPSMGRPFADKPRLHLSRESFNQETTSGVFFTPGENNSRIEYINEGTLKSLSRVDGNLEYRDGDAVIVLNGVEMRVLEVKGGKPGDTYTLEDAVNLYVLLDAFESSLSYLFPAV